MVAGSDKLRTRRHRHFRLHMTHVKYFWVATMNYAETFLCATWEAQGSDVNRFISYTTKKFAHGH